MGAFLALMVAFFIGIAVFCIGVNPVIGKIAGDAIRIDKEPSGSSKNQTA